MCSDHFRRHLHKFDSFGLCLRQSSLPASDRFAPEVGGRAVNLSSKEFGLLVELIGSKGRVLSRDSILDRVWGAECYVTPRTVDTHIRRLRAKLRGAGEYIETVRGAGYRFKEE